jgi:hypothetical protein
MKTTYPTYRIKKIIDNQLIIKVGNLIFNLTCSYPMGKLGNKKKDNFLINQSDLKYCITTI